VYTIKKYNMSVNILSLFNKYKGVIIALLLASAMLLGFGSTVASYAQDRLTPNNSAICPGGNCPVTGDNDFNDTTQDDIVGFIIGVAQFLTFISAGLAILFMVYGGIRYIVAADGDGSESGKKILINATIGLIVAIVAYTVVSVVAGLLQGTLIDF
jgi:hypothetical protein